MDMKRQRCELGCPTIREKRLGHSGYRDAADPRYQSCDFARQTTIFCDLVRLMLFGTKRGSKHATNMDQLEDLVAATRLKLDKEAIAQLDAASA